MVIGKDMVQSWYDNHLLEKWEVTMKKKQKNPRVRFSISEDTSHLLLLSPDSTVEEYGSCCLCCLCQTLIPAGVRIKWHLLDWLTNCAETV